MEGILEVMFQRFDLVLAEVPFEDCAESKIRPVLIVDNEAYLVRCFGVTSNPSRPEDYVIKEWKAAGLRKPSAIRVQRIIALDADFVGYKIGHLQPIDIYEIQKMLSLV